MFLTLMDKTSSNLAPSSTKPKEYNFFNQDHPERAEQAVVKQEKPKKKATKKTKEKEPKGGQK
jgi:hypothetical protein